jgi:hypothetical protein
MGKRIWARLMAALALALSVGALISAIAAPAHAQDASIKIGGVYHLTGPFAGGGSDLHHLGAKIVID